MYLRYILLIAIASIISCKKNDDSQLPAPVTENFTFAGMRINNVSKSSPVYNVSLNPSIKLSFTANVDRVTVSTGIALRNAAGQPIPFTPGYENGDSTVIITTTLQPISKFTVSLTNALKSNRQSLLGNVTNIQLFSHIDSTDKFPTLSDNALLDKVQQQTFKYFWDFAHPVSGLARERNTSGEIVTSGGSGFGIMSIPVAINRSFITRAQGLARMQTIVSFLKNTAQRFHGAFPHWLNGSTGAVVPFSQNDNGADLVETSYLMQGLICAREYFNAAGIEETNLRNDINVLWNDVEWDWFRQGTQNVLYWHWSPNLGFIMNAPVSGWNEALITYVMAASSVTHPVPKIVYDNGWARNGAMVNNNIFFSYTLPLGPDRGGPLFFEHYSFMGIDPNGLSDAYANYTVQTTNHTKINYEYCKANPKQWYGFSNLCWGLTASDVPNGYNANSPTNDIGVISPTAALSSFPYTPTESMNALKFFYYKLGDKLWGEYGFYDAFSLKEPWFASSTLAIDQGPIIVMIENYRSGLLWNLFTGAPEIKDGMRDLGFTAPYL